MLGHSYSSSSQRFWERIVERPLVTKLFLPYARVAEDENKKAMDVLAVKQANHSAFVACFLLFLSIAYMVMFYAFLMHPDDLFFSVIAMFLLFGSSALTILLMFASRLWKFSSPQCSRFIHDFYFACLLAVTGLYFWAAASNPNNVDHFCPSFLYLLIFALVSSPYLIDSFFFFFGALAVILSVSIFAGTSTVLILQYSLIGLILCAGMIYLSSLNYLGEIKAVRLNEANDELRFLSTHDQLTGANNRHSLHTYLSQVSADFIVQKTPVAFIMFDVDSFKSLNDHYSHMQGDEALKSLVNSIKNAHLFPDSYFFRFGGDEFLVVLPNASVDEVNKIGAAIVKVVYANKIPAAPDAPYPYLSVSAGAYRGSFDETKNLDDYLAVADKELYLAKAQGHNRFCFLSEEAQ
jgi:diguanylate cyclase (GGDEF)-like protein